MLNPLELTAEQQEEIFNENEIDDFNYEHVEDLPWKDDGKYQLGGCIFKHDDKFYAIWAARSGSYFSDYNFQFDGKVTQVEKKQIVREEWVNV